MSPGKFWGKIDSRSIIWFLKKNQKSAEVSRVLQHPRRCDSLYLMQLLMHKPQLSSLEVTFKYRIKYVYSILQTLLKSKTSCTAHNSTHKYLLLYFLRF